MKEKTIEELFRSECAYSDACPIGTLKTGNSLSLSASFIRSIEFTVWFFQHIL